MTAIDPRDLSRGELSQLVTGLVAPRPIAWVSTLSPGGAGNLAPFSFFNAFSFSPPVLAIGPGIRGDADKDSLSNIRATGELTISVVTEELAERANACSAEFPPEVDEWEVAEVTRAASTHVRPPYVMESPAAFECRVRQIVELGTAARRANALVIADVVCLHVRDDILVGLAPRAEALRLVGRMGGSTWCTTRDAFVLERPASADPAEVAASPPTRRA